MKRKIIKFHPVATFSIIHFIFFLPYRRRQRNTQRMYCGKALTTTTTKKKEKPLDCLKYNNFEISLLLFPVKYPESP